MLRINKAASHDGLEDWKRRYKARHKRKANYPDLFDANDLYRTVKEDIIREQKGLCCYCCCQLDENDSHIEHFMPQSKFPSLDLDFGNLFVSCNGGRKKATCGYKKGSIDPSEKVISPTDDQCSQAFKYTLRGKIEATGLHELSQSTIDTLSLNNPALASAREAVLWASGLLTADEDEHSTIIEGLLSEADTLPA